MAENINEPKLRGYVFLLNLDRITIDDVPEPYKSEIIARGLVK